MNATSNVDDACLAGVPWPVRAPRSRLGDSQDGLKAAPAEAVALGGVVIRPDRAMSRGWVVVEDGIISAIVTKRSADVLSRPGLFDLHGRPEFNVFAPWEPPKALINLLLGSSLTLFELHDRQGVAVEVAADGVTWAAAALSDVTQCETRCTACAARGRARR